MGTELRRGRPYYYRKVWRDGTCVSEYVGGGELGRLCAAMDAGRSEERASVAAGERSERLRLEHSERSARACYDEMGRAARALLAAEGYHQHKRGEWRRAMGKANAAKAPPLPTEPAAVADLAADLLRRSDAGDSTGVEGILARAGNGDRAAMPILRAMMDREPHRFVGGDLAYQAEESLIVQASGGKPSLLEMARRKMHQVKKALEGDDPAPVERLLARRATLCWFTVHQYEAVYTQARDLSLKQAAYHQDRIDRAHRRFLSAVGMLEKVRALRRPRVVIHKHERPDRPDPLPDILEELKQRIAAARPQPDPWEEEAARVEAECLRRGLKAPGISANGQVPGALDGPPR